MKNTENNTPHWSALPPPYTQYEMDIMKQKGEKVSQLTKTYMKEMGINATSHFTGF